MSISIKFGTLVQDITDRIVEITGEKVESVSKGSVRFVPASLPIALVSVGRIGFVPETSESMMGRVFSLLIPVEIVVVIRDTAPTDWLSDIIPTLGSITDALAADTSLGGKCEDSYPDYCEPARLTLAGEGAGGKIYYGGLIGYIVKAFYRV